VLSLAPLSVMLQLSWVCEYGDALVCALGSVTVFDCDYPDCRICAELVRRVRLNIWHRLVDAIVCSFFVCRTGRTDTNRSSIAVVIVDQPFSHYTVS
jgi:hypothetical protein